jgi:metal-dependent amidase/aminoacylase/carboxypeptidase family protein
MMRLMRLISLALVVGKASAVPFRTRGGKDTTDETLPTDAVVVSDGDIVTMMSRQIVRRSPVVESFFSSEGFSVALRDEIRTKASNITDFLVSTRRILHQQPELMFNEQETSKTVQKILSELQISFTTGWSRNTHQDVYPGKGGYGVVADIGTGKAPCVLLRADMDALPILERTENIDSFKSRNDGRMHACGHDGHTTMLLGAASILKGMEDSINGTIRVMFQPAEEGGAGAKRMIEEGVLDMDPKPSYAFGMHVWPT